jgi:3-hydroxybutyryl-CoA dehydrogenase
MGTGIAQVAAAAGHTVILGDAQDGATAKAKATLTRALDREVEKKKLARSDAEALIGRITFHPQSLGDNVFKYEGCGLIIEAIVESLPEKRRLFRNLEEVVDDQAIIATNTSSLSVTGIASACEHPERVLGLHFFNPAPVLPLVEVVPWTGTSPALPDAAKSLMAKWGKTPVLTSDTPGFIVNRIARPFYGEALRIAEEGIADFATVDAAMRELGGFKMGPFELMDFIGNDVNFAVTKSVFEAFFYEPRYRPSLTQQRLVEANALGRKSGRGYYQYGDGVAKPEAKKDPVVGLLVFERILAMLINEAADAVHRRVATPADIDLAMTKGVNYPKGLLSWCDELGAERVFGWMVRLHDEYREDRYRPSPLLRTMAREGTRFFA